MASEEIAQLVFDSIREVSDFASEILTTSFNDTLLNKDFIDIGINSIDYNHLLAIVTEKLNVKFPPERFLTSTNIGQCVNIIAHLYAENQLHREGVLGIFPPKKTKTLSTPVISSL